MKSMQRVRWAAACAAVMAASCAGGQGPAIEEPAPPAQAATVAVVGAESENIDAVEIDRVIVAEEGLADVVGHVDGLERVDDRTIGVYELRLVAVCPPGAQCIKCDPDGNQPDCGGIPPLPPPPPPRGLFTLIRAAQNAL